MKKFSIVLAGLLFVGLAVADNVAGVNRMLCSSNHVMLCVETGECFSIQPWEIEVPQFVVIDLKKKSISTTASSELSRSTPLATVHKVDGSIYLQGFEAGRAFSIVIEEDLGTLNAAVARDGMSVTVFGACTNAEP